MNNVWVEKYRPRDMSEFIWASPNLKTNVDKWIAQEEIPNVLFSGGAGRGKTSLARLLVRAIGIPECDILDINASKERKVDDFTDLISNFSSTWAMGDKQMKYIILDEADRLTPHSQDFLRAEIERTILTSRFILTCNRRDKITPFLHSRLQEFEFAALDKEETVMRAVSMLASEKVNFEPEELIKYVDAYYPDFRKCINVLQQRSASGSLQPFTDNSGDANDYLIEILTHLVSGNSKSARQAVLENCAPDDYISVFRFIFTNIAVFDGDDLQDQILLTVRDGMYKHTLVADSEINMAATMAEICKLARK